MKNIKHYAFPSEIEDAMAILLDEDYKALVMAGGTLVGKTIPASAETYLDIRNLPLKEIKEKDGRLSIGACATFDEIDNSPLCREWAGGIISQAASKCSSQLVRNMATMGGNIAKPHAFNIFPLLLLGMDAEVVVATGEGQKTLKYADLPDHKELNPGANCIILEVLFPAETKGKKYEFIKLAKTNSSWESYVNLFLSNDKDNPKFVVGALTPRPFNAEKACKAYRENAPVEEVLATFKTEAEAAKGPGYRAEAATNLLRRFLGAE